MALTIITYCSYFTRYGELRARGQTPAQGTYDSTKFVDAIKGETVKGWAMVPDGNGNIVSLNDRNKQLAYGWFADAAYRVLRSSDDGAAVCFVPVPSSNCSTFDAGRNTAPHRIAAELARRFKNGRVERLLMWDQQMTPSRTGGTRDPSILLNHLRVRRPQEEVQEHYVLVDDVVTTGGHFIAARQALEMIAKTVWFCIAVGKSTQVEQEPAFRIRWFDVDNREEGDADE